MKQLFRQGFLILVLIALYFAAKLYAQGRFLNEMLPIPILSWLFYAVVLFALYKIILQPIIEFRQLTRADRSGSSDIVTEAEYIRRQLEKKGKDEDYWKINDELNRLEKNEEVLADLTSKYYEKLSSEASETITQYSWKAALCVVFSRNNFIDGVLMLFAQLKMAMKLMELYGYKLSPLFNMLCFFWIATNSAMNGIFSQATADSVGDVFADMLLDGGIITEGLSSKLIARMSSFILEALTAATTVHVTGIIINRKLRGERKNITIKELFKIRRESWLKLLNELPRNLLSKAKKRDA